MLMLLEAVIIMQAVTEGEFCIQPEYKQAIVYLAKKCEIMYQEEFKIPF